MALKKLVGDMELMPKGYGIAYMRYDILAAVCYPIPLNVFVHYLRRLWVAWKWFGQQDYFAKLIYEAETRGYKHGYRMAKLNEKNLDDFMQEEISASQRKKGGEPC
jgi:hypothetical protein